MVYQHRQASSRQMFIPIMMVALLAWALPTVAYAEPGDSASQIFLPIVAMTEQVTASAACELNDWEKTYEIEATEEDRITAKAVHPYRKAKNRL